MLNESKLLLIHNNIDIEPNHLPLKIRWLMKTGHWKYIFSDSEAKCWLFLSVWRSWRLWLVTWLSNGANHKLAIMIMNCLLTSLPSPASGCLCILPTCFSQPGLQRWSPADVARLHPDVSSSFQRVQAMSSQQLTDCWYETDKEEKLV